jgi:hypothetical protein
MKYLPQSLGVRERTYKDWSSNAVEDSSSTTPKRKG